MRRPLHELVNIRAAGGGMVLSAADWPTQDLIQLASAGGGKGILVIDASETLSPQAAVNIAAAGNGSVLFRESA